MDAAPTHIADDHLDLLCVERPLVHAWFEVLFEAEVERAAGIVLQPMAGRPASLESAPEGDDIDPVDEAEHDELGEALVADDPEDKVLPEEVDAPAKVEAPERWGWRALTFDRTHAFLHGRG